MIWSAVFFMIIGCIFAIRDGWVEKYFFRIQLPKSENFWCVRRISNSEVNEHFIIYNYK